MSSEASAAAAEQGKAGTTTPASSKKPDSIENARRFLYDEDEEDVVVASLPATTSTNLSSMSGNTPLPHPRDMKSRQSQQQHRLNPFLASIMASCTTCRTIGLKTVIIATGLILVLFLVITAIVRGGLGGGGAKNEKSDRQRQQVLMEQITTAGISAPLQLSDVTTPQYHALQYLANIDQTTPGLGDGDKDKDIVLQKYGLAVLFYATSGISLGEDTSHKHEDKGASNDIQWISHDNWMSSTVGVCEWYGIECEFSALSGNDDITSLRLSENMLQGSLPSELSAMSKLLNLDLSKNSLTGTLPKSLPTTMKDLRSFEINENSFQGWIPNEYGDFSNLRSMDIGKNNLEGTIPVTIPRIISLQSLKLEHNSLKGPIPDFQDEYKLAYLHLDDNDFTGPIPPSIIKLTMLVSLGLSTNHLTGTIPQGLDKLLRLRKFNYSPYIFHCTGIDRYSLFHLLSLSLPIYFFPNTTFLCHFLQKICI